MWPGAATSTATEDPPPCSPVRGNPASGTAQTSPVGWRTATRTTPSPAAAARSTCHRCPGHSVWVALRRARDSHPTNPSVKSAVRSPMTTVEVADPPESPLSRGSSREGGSASSSSRGDLSLGDAPPGVGVSVSGLWVTAWCRSTAVLECKALSAAAGEVSRSANAAARGTSMTTVHRLRPMRTVRTPLTWPGGTARVRAGLICGSVIGLSCAEE